MNKNSFYLSLYNKIESFKPNLLEIICFSLYIILTMTISCFHEPWFDEFQAWGISKDSIYNILFVIPHLEGHPPLWHLFLKCFTIFDIPAELSIKIPNLLFMYASVWLILFKSPFPRIVRLALPFTYFIFYQYAIVSRPYSMLTFALFLSAVLDSSKNERPFRYIASLGFLALTSLYGMIIATGLTFAWVYEICNKQNFIIFIKSFLKDKRFFAMLSLFFLCLAISFMIYPDKNVTANACLLEVPIWWKIPYYLFVIISDSLLLNIFNYYIVSFVDLNLFEIIFVYSVSFYIVYVLFSFLKKINALVYFIILYFLISFFFYYVSPHHLGVIFIYLMTVFWIIFYKLKNGIVLKNKKENIILLAIIFLIQIFWSITSFYNEIRSDYSPSRKIAKFIKRYSLNDYSIFSEWSISRYYTLANGKRFYIKTFLDKDKSYKEGLTENTNYQIPAVLINPYFKENIFSNFNITAKDKFYIIHLNSSEAENIANKSLWYKNNEPDIIISNCRLVSEPFYKYILNYNLLKIFNSNFILKNTMDSSSLAIYVRKDKYIEIKHRIDKIDKAINTF